MRAVEDLKHVVAGQTTKLAPDAGTRHQFNAPIARFAFGTDNIGFFHVPERIIRFSAAP